MTYTGERLIMKNKQLKSVGGVTTDSKYSEIEQEWNEIGAIPTVISELPKIARKDREFRKLSPERQKTMLRILSEELEQEFQDRLGACIVKYVKHESECRKAEQVEL